MCVGRAAAKLARALRRDHRIGAATVGRAALAAHEALLLEPVDEPRHAAAGEQRGIGELAHAQVLVTALREHEQHLVLGHGEPVRLLELGIEPGQHAARACAGDRATRRARGARAVPRRSLWPCPNFTRAGGQSGGWRRYCGAVAEVTYPRGDPHGDGGRHARG